MGRCLIAELVGMCSQGRRCGGHPSNYMSTSMPLYCRATSTYLHHVPQIPAPGFLPLVLLIDLQDALLQTSRKSSEDSFRPTLLKLENFSSPWKPLQQRQPSNEQSHLVGPEAVDRIPLPPVVPLGIPRSSKNKKLGLHIIIMRESKYLWLNSTQQGQALTYT